MGDRAGTRATDLASVAALVGYLGKLTQKAETDDENPVSSGGWVIRFDPAAIGIRIDSEVYHIAVKGPTGSTFEVWVDTTFYDIVARGDKNSWDPSQPMHIQSGSTIFFYYDTSAGTAPKATLFFREPSPI